MITIEHLLKDMRVKLSMTQEQLAERIGLSKQVISAYELKKRKPSLLNSHKIVSASNEICGTQLTYKDIVE